MGLTSQALVLLVTAVGTVWFAAAVWLWPRLGRRSTWKSVLGRMGVLLSTQLATITALALLANSYFGFYGSWDDLIGTAQDTGTATGATTAGAHPLNDAVHVLDRTPLSPPEGARGRSGGTLESVEISGATSGLISPAYVYLPAQYEHGARTGMRFPVIVALTGYPGTAENLITRLAYPTLEAQAIARGEMHPAVLVLMRPTLVPPRDTECMDIPHGPRVETYFTQDLPRAIASAYRVGTRSANRGIIGDSTGGYCALKLAMRHPEVYSAAVSLSGYYKPAVDLTTGDLFNGSRQLEMENDLLWRLAHLPAPPVSVLIASSRRGERDYQATRDFIAAARQPIRVSTLILPSGGHNFATWKRELTSALPWLGQALSPTADAT